MTAIPRLGEHYRKHIPMRLQGFLRKLWIVYTGLGLFLINLAVWCLHIISGASSTAMFLECALVAGVSSIGKRASLNQQVYRSENIAILATTPFLTVAGESQLGIGLLQGQRS